MEKYEIIEKIYGDLYSCISSGNYDLERYKGYWGKSTYSSWKELYVGFVGQLRKMAQESTLLYGEGSFWMFDGRIYITVTQDLIEQAYNRFIETMGILPMVNNRNVCKSDFIDVIKYWKVMSIRNDIIAFKNGVLDMNDMSFHDFDARYHVTYMHPYDYKPKAGCPKWLSFLHEVLPDKSSRLILQMFLGLGLIERGTVYNQYEGKDNSKVELCLMLIGQGANGKSVIYKTAMGIFGERRISGIDYDELTGTGDEGMRARRLLRDALFNWSSDSDSRTFGKKRVGVFKRIVSGEPVTDRKIGEDVSQNYRMPYLIFNLNELPHPDDQSLGFIRRLQFITFDITIPKDKQNKSLAYELTSEYPGIFNWIVRGMKEVKRRKFVFPSSEGNRRQILLTQLRMNPVLAWINAYQVRSEPEVSNEIGILVPAKEMLDSINTFCEDNDVDGVSFQKMGATFRSIGRGFLKKKRKMDGWNYMVYGCTVERMKLPFVIQDEKLDTEYVNQDGTYIDESD
jgi:putative DNA primase/helicase